MSNHLADAISPYLLQHKDNPVDWYPWGDDALKLAARRDVPILLSIGYAACHWCHVMAHECFEDQEVANYLNQNFVAIKVDREERPDLDAIYMDALMTLQGHGGWPLNLCLTPQGKPFFGGTYFPKHSNASSVGFIELLQQLSDAWQQRREEINHFSEQLSKALQTVQSGSSTQASVVSYNEIAQQASAWLDYFDSEQGGLKGAPKFPQVNFWRHITAASIELKDHALQNAAQLTAIKLCRGGIYDHIGGGWMRYSTDEQWLVPHFEKMLYDNAQLILWLSELNAYKPNPEFKYCIEKSISWLKREMLTDNNSFAASLDADSEGSEGKYYVWQQVEIEQLLKGKAAAFCKAFDITQIGNWEHHNIPHRNHAQYQTTDLMAFDAELSVLLNARLQRVPPARDDKILADWNGLIITALAKASQVFHEHSWLQLAEQSFREIEVKLYHKQQLYHCYRQGIYQHVAFIEDYANMIAAAIAIYLATGDKMYLNKAQEWCLQVDKNYWNSKANSYQQRSQAIPELIANPIMTQDGALPSGNGIMAENLAKLWYLTQEQVYYDKVVQLLGNFSKILKQKNGALYSGYCLAQALLDNGLVIKIPRVKTDLTRELYKNLPPWALVLSSAELINSIEVCVDNTCLPKFTECEELAVFLNRYAQ